MAAPNLSRRFIILLGDGAEPETFAFPCGANARSVTMTNNLGEEATLDCDNPLDELAAIQRWLESQDTTLSVSGRVAKGDTLTMWRTWVDAKTDEEAQKNIRILLDETSANGGGYYTVPAYIGSMEWGAEGKGTIEFTAEIMGSGPRIWTDAT